MYVTRQTNYALRILMYCGVRQPQLSKVPVIAAQYQISETYLFKIMPVLTQNGFIEAVRGRNGGIRLGKAPEEVSIGAVFRCTEDRLALAECFESDSSDCPLVGSCQLRGVWTEAYEAFVGVLDRYTVADLIRPGQKLADRLGLNMGIAS